MTSSYRCCAVLALLFLSACGEWPPHATELTERFNAKRADFEALERKLLSTDYVRASGGCYTNKEGELAISSITVDTKVETNDEHGYFLEQESIDDAEWAQLFCEASTWSVESHEEHVAFPLAATIEKNGMDVAVSYIHSRKPLESRKPCQAKHKEIPCGLCAVVLDSDWYLEYWWVPIEIVAGGPQTILDGEHTEEEYWALFDSNLKQCRMDGYAAIGYDVSKM